MSLIKLEDTMLDILEKMSAGNPGAATVLIHLYKESAKIDPQCAFEGLGPILSLDTYKIYGPDIWILAKDICKQDIVHMLALLRSVQLGITPLDDLKAWIFAAREGLDMEQVKCPVLDLPVILQRVMEELDQFNRPQDENKPAQIPPSYFMQQGVPTCSMWGKAEAEYLAWAYVAAMAADGDTWHPMTAEQCYNILRQDEAAHQAVNPFLRYVVEGDRDKYNELWRKITEQLTSADKAFDVGGLAWNRYRYERQQAEPQPA